MYPFGPEQGESAKGGIRTHTPFGQRLLRPPWLPLHHSGIVPSISVARDNLTGDTGEPFEVA